MDAFRAALRAADFESVRGSFAFGTNQHPIQDLYIREVIRTGDGFTNKTVRKVFTNHVDAYAAECPM
jgi:branched-chain amino acid transport system substrate-binding protein